MMVPKSRNAVETDLGTWWYPQLGGPESLLAYARSIDAVKLCRELFDTLSEDKYLLYVKEFYDQGRALWGDSWVFHDINTVLLSAALSMKPESYMEIGVRRARSAAMVLSQQPDCAFSAFDMWIPEYAGMENPGPDFVKAELDRLGHRGPREFIDGNSLETVPRYFAENPDRFFDIITVDGDHSIAGARADLVNVKERVKIGGLLVFDDTANQGHAGLGDVWDETIAGDPRFTSFVFNEVGFGIGIATRKF
ncbi:class I SAM-dependent methyltransferase [Aurantiacibacter rhizosphaerae]|nr:class I SAM-dependent methyltransferase [Aurantiacibacter rhizosphaerae]